jgi:hypothetical protein
MNMKATGVIQPGDRLRCSAGVCLVEMLIATTAGIVVLSAALQSLEHFQTRLWKQIEAMDRQQEVRIGLKIFTDELRLAGTGAGPIQPALTKCEPQEIEFFANLDAHSTTLSQSVAAGEKGLVVFDGFEWPKGKRILVCDEEGCREGRLGRTGQKNLLTMVEPLGEAIPSGRVVFISNTIRYYLGKNRIGTPSLIREVDGGANALIADVTGFHVAYSDRHGNVTHQPERIARVHVELAVANGQTIRTEVGLRGRI